LKLNKEIPMHVRRLLLLVVVLAGVGASLAGQQSADTATLILRNGRIVTVDDKMPEAQAIAVKGDTILAVGTNEQIAKLAGPQTQVIDLRGQFAMPGFIEGHGHFMGVGQARMNLNLMKVKNWDEVVSMVADAAKKAKPGDWILGRGWHQEKWNKAPQPNVEGFPVHDALSKVSPDNPVLLTHASGHASFANAKAMALAKVTKDTSNPAGGEILKDANGQPIGIFRETASSLIARAVGEWRRGLTPAQLEAEARRQIELAAEESLAKGVTSFQDAGVPFETVDLYKKVVDEGKLPLRLWVMIRERPEVLAQKLASYRMIDYGDKRLTVRAIKLSLDGALGPRGAWLLEPYKDLPTSSGLNTAPIPQAKETARLAMQHDYQYCVHAIGDRANRETLDIFEEAFKANPAKKDVRWRIEHAQHLHPTDIPRLGRLSVIAAMQGIHCTSDAPYVLARLGPKRAEEGAYVWQRLMRTGAVVSNGTDAPVEDVDPIASYYASVTRRLADGSLFFPDQRMTRMEALKSYTLAAAYSAFEEGSKGSLTPGKLADITVLTKDITRVPDAEIQSARVAMTIVGGKVAYRAAGGTSDAAR
jgi:hypothetical protein